MSPKESDKKVSPILVPKPAKMLAIKQYIFSHKHKQQNLLVI